MKLALDLFGPLPVLVGKEREVRTGFAWRFRKIRLAHGHGRSPRALAVVNCRQVLRSLGGLF